MESRQYSGGSQYGGLCGGYSDECVTPSVRKRLIISMVESVQYGGGYAVRTCNIISMDMSHLRRVESM